jgi:hypothetical protein
MFNPCDDCKINPKNGGDGRALFDDLPCYYRCAPRDEYLNNKGEEYHKK